MKYDTPARVLDIIWRMRLVEKDRSNNRAILNRHFNGDPPFEPGRAEENGVQINRNFLKGVQVLADARRQWNQAMMSDDKFFTVTVDCGPIHKRDNWGTIITKNLNKELRRTRHMIENVRSTGAGMVLHGIGPSVWSDRYTPVPKIIPLSSLLIPSETELDFDNLPHYAIYREFTPYQLFKMTHGARVDPRWNMEIVDAVLKKVFKETQRAVNTSATEYSLENVEELVKQDGGYWGSDAAPVVPVWDFYFYDEDENGSNVYRRMVLDASLGEGVGEARPVLDNGTSDQFLYNGGKGGELSFAGSIGEVLHCQFGDCSAVAPFKYHSVRSLGWLLWGVTDLENRLECRFTEAVFENMMWFFRSAGENDFNRLRKADFYHMGIIPNGIGFVKNEERFIPNPNLVEQARMTFRQRIAETAASYTHDFDKGSNRTQLTATETMARVNSTNALVQGMMTLAYLYEDHKDREIARRFCIKDSPNASVIRFRSACLREGVPLYALDVERWDVRHNRVIGAGNKTVQMASVQFLQSIRKNLPPESQRKVDHLSIAALDKAGLADDLAPLDEFNPVSNSKHDAELATDRLMRGLQLSQRPDMVYEEYVATWLKDMAMMVERALATNSGSPDFLVGIQNMATHVGQFLQAMSSNDEDKPKIRVYGNALSQIMNHVKGIAQRLAEAQQAQGAGAAGGEAAAQAAKVQGQVELNQIKAENLKQTHAQKAAQAQAAFELEQRREDKRLAVELQRRQAEFEQELQQKIADAELEREQARELMRLDAVKAAQELEHAERAAEQSTKKESTEE